jgi:hypothetical protein
MRFIPVPRRTLRTVGSHAATLGRLSRTVPALALAVALTGCVSQGGSAEAEDSPMCTSLVGRPINEAFSDTPAPGILRLPCIRHLYRRALRPTPGRPRVRGVLPGQRWDKRWAPQKPTPMFWFGADDGTYFGRLGGVLHFKPGGVSQRVMCHLTGGHARHCGTWWQWH